MTLPLLIVGASARAAAWSALRAGLTPFAADLFTDRDLNSVAPCVRVPPDAYPEGLIGTAAAQPASPWLYTGALENRPDLVDRLAAFRPLWGNHGATLRVARDPIAVAEVVRSAGLPVPEVRLAPDGLPRDGSWLRKPLASAGGRDVAALGPDTAPARRPVYFQERIDGLSLSAVFIAAGGKAVLAGVTRQLVGRAGAEFAYRGNLAPWPVEAKSLRRIETLGNALVHRIGLVGLFGVDLVLDDNGRPWPVEVNPRYTASVEVIELATGRPLMDDHRRACEGRDIALSPLQPSPRRFVAKEIVYAETDGLFCHDEPPLAVATDPFRIPCVADVPEAGTPIAAGDPVLTVFAEGPTPEEALHALERARGEWERRWAAPGLKGS